MRERIHAAFLFFSALILFLLFKGKTFFAIIMSLPVLVAMQFDQGPVRPILLVFDFVVLGCVFTIFAWIIWKQSKIILQLWDSRAEQAKKLFLIYGAIIVTVFAISKFTFAYYVHTKNSELAVNLVKWNAELPEQIKISPNVEPFVKNIELSETRQESPQVIVKIFWKDSFLQSNILKGPPENSVRAMLEQLTIPKDIIWNYNERGEQLNSMWRTAQQQLKHYNQKKQLQQKKQIQQFNNK